MNLPEIDPIPLHLQQRGAAPELLRDELLAIITHAIEHHPRSLQTALGPSEVGCPCPRRLAYQFLALPERNLEPNWKATVGTAVHAWLEDVFTTDNVQQTARADNVTRWLVEHKVNTGSLDNGDLFGHCDLFDRVTGTVVDWKTTGPVRMKKYRSKGPGEQYRAQAHLYGRGWVARGQHVERVAILFFPRNGELRDSYWWSEPYDEQVAIDALRRAEGISIAAKTLGTAVLSMLPTAESFCLQCPFYRFGSTDLTQGCPGDPAVHRPHKPALTLG